MPEEKEPYISESSGNAIGCAAPNFQELTVSRENLNSEQKKEMLLSNQIDENNVPTCHTAFPVDLKEVFELTNPSEEIHQTILRPSNEINSLQYAHSSQILHSPKPAQDGSPENEQVSWRHVLREHTNEMDSRPPSQIHHSENAQSWDNVMDEPQDLSEPVSVSEDEHNQSVWSHVITKQPTHNDNNERNKQLLHESPKDQSQIVPPNSHGSWNNVMEDMQNPAGEMQHNGQMHVLDGHKTWDHVMSEQQNHQDVSAPVINLSSSECSKLTSHVPERRDASCQVDNISNPMEQEESPAHHKSAQNCKHSKSQAKNNPSALEEVPQSLLNLTIVSSESQGAPSQVVIHNGIRPELYTQERHLVVEAGTKAQVSTKNSGTYPCIHCSKVFGDSRSLQRHILIHVGLRPYRCPVCGKAFMLNGDLTRHIRIHSGERPYACEVCGRRFTLKGNLMQHFRTHTPEKQYACTICEKNYAQKDSLHRHIRAHFGEKPFECTTCGKRFTLKGDLSRHILIHSGVKPHSCKFCGRQFALKGNLTQHVRTHVRSQSKLNDGTVHTFVKAHSDPPVIRDLSYSHLEKTFTSMSNSASSLKLSHCISSEQHSSLTLMDVKNTPHPYVQNSTPSEINHQSSSGLSFCSECSKTFPSSESLHDHVQLIHEQSTRLASNRYLCNICQKEFSLKGDLTRHLNSHNGVKPYECEYCNKTFTLKSNLRQHLTTHRIDKSFACPMCSKSFGNRRNLNLHLRRHEQARANFTCTKCGRSFLAKSDHFFHDCVKDERSPHADDHHPSMTTNEILNGHVSPPPSPHDNMCSSAVTVQASTDEPIQTSVPVTISPVKREMCHMPCDERGIGESLDHGPHGISGVNGTQSFLGPFYRHLYFSTSHQTMLPTLKGLLHTSSSGDSKN